jgi:2-succinyl-6-hydroxy-2,4-cyclohexadiene-1-carboxylate synthase
VLLIGIISAVPGDVTFVPGFMQRGEAWQPVAAALSQRYRVRSLDFATWTFEERLDEIASATTPGDALVGYSMGGRIALHAALRDPHRFRALVLIGVSAGVEDREERRRSDEALADWMERSSIEDVVERWERLPVFATQSEELRAQQRPGRLSHDPQQLATLLRSAGQGALEPVWERLHELRCPALLVAGELDRHYADAARRMARRMPDARVRLIPDAGHAPHLEQPTALCDLLLEFLDEHLGDGGVVDGEP